MGLLEFFGFGKKIRRKTKRKTKRRTLKGKKVMYVRSRTGRAKKIKKCKNRQGKICWKYSNGKTVARSVRKYSTKTSAQRKTKTKRKARRKTKRRARFGQKGKNQDGSLAPGYQNAISAAQKAGGGYADYFGKLQPHIQASGWWYPKPGGKWQSPQMIKGGPYQNAKLRPGTAYDAGYPQAYF